MSDVAAPASSAGGLTDEQQHFVESIRDFCARECSGERLERLTKGHTDPHNDEIARRMAELGWYGLCIPEEYGGSGGSFLDATLFLEETTRGEAPIGAYPVTLIVVGALNRFGSEDQKRELLGRVASGGTLAIAMSEPEAGSDVASLKTSAQREGGDWVLSGSKMWCSFAHKASHVLIVCRSEDTGNPHEGMSMILMPRGADGFTITPIETLGGEDTNELHLDEVRVPGDALLGAEGGGWTQLMAGLNNERVILAATALGLAQRAFDDALAYAKERRQFGKPIAEFQAVQFKLADMATEIEAGRNLVYKAAWLKDEGRSFAKEAAMAKLYTGELSHRVANWALQIHGGYGYMEEYAISRFYRDQKILEIGEGTNEVQRMVIARHLGL